MTTVSAQNPVEDVTVDVLIIGSGPVGCTYARKLVAAGRSVFMVDAGAALSRRPGEHLKNAYLYQRDVNLFASVIRGHLQPVSVSVNNAPVVTLDPGAFQVDLAKYKGFVRNNQNPDQDPNKNLDGVGVTYAVGGMTTHWTCATPRHHPTMERNNLIPAGEWDRLYAEGEQILGTRRDQFDESMRHTIVLEALREEFKELKAPYNVQPLPLAVERRKDNPEMVHWTGTDRVLGPLADGSLDQPPFILKQQHCCKRLHLSADGKSVAFAEIDDLMHGSKMHVRAKLVVVAANAMLTPQILFASGIRPDPLGRYLTEQPLAFCQIVLRQDLMDRAALDSRFTEKMKKHRAISPTDPVPMPEYEPEPQVWIPVSEGRPWHCQIHRDAFNYGELAPNVDSRLIVDLRWFGIVKQRPDNRITFSEVNRDLYGLPQPTFEFTLSEEDRRSQHLMMRDMLRAAGALGGFLPGSLPQFMPPGIPIHVNGTVRLGDDPKTSVVDSYSKVWGIDNLYLGGNGLHAIAHASNPTLSSVALALRATEHIIKNAKP